MSNDANYHNLPVDAQLVPEPAGDPGAGASAFAYPKHLKVICTICLVLGILGLFAVPLGAIGIAVTYAGTAPAVVPGGGGAGDKMADLVNEMQQETLAIQHQFLEINIASLAVHLVVGLLLTIGGFLSLRFSERGRSVLLFACVVAVAFELLRGVGQVLISMEQAAVTNSFMTRMMEVNRGQPGANSFSLIMQSATLIGLAFAVAWIVAKVAFYILAFSYLRREEVDEVFQNAAHRDRPA